MHRPDFDAAYRKTSYRVDASPDAGFAIRIDEPCPPLDDLLGRTGTTTWAYVTACNPRSERLPAEENATRMDRLRQRIASRGYAVLPGAGVPDDTGWSPEPSYLVLGIPAPAAAALGRLFGQHAIVVGTRGEPARLLWITGGDPVEPAPGLDASTSPAITRKLPPDPPG